MENESSLSKEGVLEPVLPGSATFAESILPPLRNSYLYEESKDCFIYSAAHLINNVAQRTQHSAFQAEKRDKGYTEEELEESFGFLLFDDESKANKLADTGLRTGPSTCTTLGDSSKGIYVSKYSDCLDLKRWYHGKSGHIAIIKLIKGRVREVTENYTQNFTPPSAGFDCHVSEQLSAVSPTTSSFLAFERTQFYLYELLDGGNAVEMCPRHVCPFAIVAFSYGKTKPAILELQEESHEKTVFYYQPWRGQLQIDPLVYEVGLKSSNGALIPAKLPKTMRADCVIRVSDLRKSLPKEIFETCFSGEVSLDHRCCSLYEVVPSEAVDTSLSLLTQELKEKELALVLRLNDCGFLVLLHSSYFLSYEDARSDTAEALQGMFIFPDSRAIQRDTKTGRKKSVLSPEVIQVLPALNYAETEVEKCPPDQQGELCVLVEQHLRSYATLIHPGLSCSPTREASMFPDQYDVPDGFKHLFPAPKWTEETESRLRLYLNQPCAFELLVARASDLLAAGREQRGDDQDDDVYYCLSSPEEAPQTPADLHWEGEAVSQADAVREGGTALDAVPEEEVHKLHQGDERGETLPEPSQPTVSEDFGKPGTTVVTKADCPAEWTEASSSPTSGNLPTELDVSITDTEKTLQPVSDRVGTVAVESAIKETVPKSTSLPPSSSVDASDAQCGKCEPNQPSQTKVEVNPPKKKDWRSLPRGRGKKRKKVLNSAVHKDSQKEPVFQTTSLPPSLSVDASDAQCAKHEANQPSQTKVEVNPPTKKGLGTIAVESATKETPLQTTSLPPSSSVDVSDAQCGKREANQPSQTKLEVNPPTKKGLGTVAAECAIKETVPETTSLPPSLLVEASDAQCEKHEANQPSQTKVEVNPPTKKGLGTVAVESATKETPLQTTSLPPSSSVDASDAQCGKHEANQPSQTKVEVNPPTKKGLGTVAVESATKETPLQTTSLPPSSSVDASDAQCGKREANQPSQTKLEVNPPTKKGLGTIVVECATKETVPETTSLPPSLLVEASDAQCEKHEANQPSQTKVEVNPPTKKGLGTVAVESATKETPLQTTSLPPSLSVDASDGQCGKHETNQPSQTKVEVNPPPKKDWRFLRWGHSKKPQKVLNSAMHKDCVFQTTSSPPSLSVEASDAQSVESKVMEPPHAKMEASLSTKKDWRSLPRGRGKRCRRKSKVQKICQKEPSLQTTSLSVEVSDVQSVENEVIHPSAKKDWRSLPRHKRRWLSDLQKVSEKRVLRSDVQNVSEKEPRVEESEAQLHPPKRKMERYSLRYGLKTIITDCGRLFVPHGSEVLTKDIESLKEKQRTMNSERSPQNICVDDSMEASQSSETGHVLASPEETGNRENKSIGLVAAPEQTQLMESDRQPSLFETERKRQASPTVNVQNVPMETTDSAVPPLEMTKDCSQDAQADTVISLPTEPDPLMDIDSNGAHLKKKTKGRAYTAISISKLRTVLVRGKRNISGDPVESLSANTEPEQKKSKADAGIESKLENVVIKTSHQNESSPTIAATADTNRLQSDPELAHIPSISQNTPEAAGSPEPSIQLGKNLPSRQVQAKHLLESDQLHTLSPTKLTNLENLIKPLKKQRRNKLVFTEENGCLNFDTSASYDSENFKLQLKATPTGAGVGGTCVGSVRTSCSQEGLVTRACLPADALTLLADLALSANSDKMLQTLGSSLESKPGQRQGTHVSVEDGGSLESESVLHALLRRPSAKLLLPPRSPFPKGLAVTGEWILVISKEHSYSQPPSLLLGLSGVPLQPPPSSGCAESLTSLTPGGYVIDEGTSTQTLPIHTTAPLRQEERIRNGWIQRSPLNMPLPSSHKDTVRKSRLSRFRHIVQKDGSIQVTRLWKEKYDFNLDSKFTNDPQDKTVTRALHGPWDFNMEDTYEQVHLIFHMWIGLFYSKPTSRFFQLDPTSPPLEGSDYTTQACQEMETVQAPVSFESNVSQRPSEIDTSLTYVPMSLPPEPEVLDLSYEGKNAAQPLLPRSEVLDLSLKSRRDSSEFSGDTGSIKTPGLEHTSASNETEAYPPYPRTTTQFDLKNYRASVDMSDKISVQGDDDPQDDRWSGFENDGVTECSYTKQLESNSTYIQLCEQASDMYINKRKLLEMQRPTHILEGKTMSGAMQKEGKRCFGTHGTYFIQSSKFTNIDLKAVTVFHQVVHPTKPVMLSEGNYGKGFRDGMPKALLDGNDTRVKGSVAVHDGNDSRNGAPITLLDGNDSKDGAPITVLGGNDSKDGAPITVLDGNDSMDGAPITVLDGNDSKDGAPITVLDGNDSKDGAPITVLDGNDSMDGAPITVLDGNDSRNEAPITVLDGNDSMDGAPITVLDGNDSKDGAPITVLDGNDSKDGAPITVLDGNDSMDGAPITVLDGNDSRNEAPITVLDGNDSKDGAHETGRVQEENYPQDVTPMGAQDGNDLKEGVHMEVHVGNDLKEGAHMEVQDESDSSNGALVVVHEEGNSEDEAHTEIREGNISCIGEMNTPACWSRDVTFGEDHTTVIANESENHRSSPRDETHAVMQGNDSTMLSPILHAQDMHQDEMEKTLCGVNSSTGISHTVAHDRGDSCQKKDGSVMYDVGKSDETLMQRYDSSKDYESKVNDADIKCSTPSMDEFPHDSILCPDGHSGVHTALHVSDLKTALHVSDLKTALHAEKSTSRSSTPTQDELPLDQELCQDGYTQTGDLLHRVANSIDKSKSGLVSVENSSHTITDVLLQKHNGLNPNIDEKSFCNTPENPLPHVHMGSNSEHYPTADLQSTSKSLSNTKHLPTMNSQGDQGPCSNSTSQKDIGNNNYDSKEYPLHEQSESIDQNSQSLKTKATPPQSHTFLNSDDMIMLSDHMESAPKHGSIPGLNYGPLPGQYHSTCSESEHKEGRANSMGKVDDPDTKSTTAGDNQEEDRTLNNKKSHTDASYQSREWDGQELDDLLDYSMARISFSTHQTKESGAGHSFPHPSRVRENEQQFDWIKYCRSERKARAPKGWMDMEEEDDPRPSGPPMSIVTVLDDKGSRITYQNYPVTKPSTSMHSRTVQNTSRSRLEEFLQKWEDLHQIQSDITQSSMDLEYLIFSEKMNQILKGSKTTSSRKRRRTNVDAAPSGSPVTIRFSSLDEQDSSEELGEALPSLTDCRIKVDMPERTGITEAENGVRPLRLRRLSCEKHTEAVHSKISDVAVECARSYYALMNNVCAGKSLPCQTDKFKRERVPPNPTTSKHVDLCGQMKKDLYNSLHDNLNSVVRQACKIKYRFYILVTSADAFFKETKELLEAEGHIAVEPDQFDLNSNSSSSPLLIILRNEDIAQHICEVPHLLELKKSSSVLFAGIDQPDDVVNLTHQELFGRGGFVVFDGAALDTLSLDNMKKIVSCLEELSRKGRWKWFLHYRDSRGLRENARSNPEAHNKKHFVDCCQEAGIVEVLPYHECDVISRDQPDYLRCLVCLQVQNASARFPVFITDTPADSFGKNGILTMNINTFSRILSSDRCTIS